MQLQRVLLALPLLVLLLVLMTLSTVLRQILRRRLIRRTAVRVALAVRTQTWSQIAPQAGQLQQQRQGQKLQARVAKARSRSNVGLLERFWVTAARATQPPGQQQQQLRLTPLRSRRGSAQQ
jgi:hypothetical protein